MGPGLDIFQDWLKVVSSDQAYCREIVMVQSSGSGKSRLVTDATRINLGILLNVGGYKSAFHFPSLLVEFILTRRQVNTHGKILESLMHCNERQIAQIARQALLFL